mgnify:CR=1 FL=1
MLRFIWLQGIKHEQYSSAAEDNRISVAPIVPNRGLILDRNGVVLGRNAPSYQLELIREQIPDLEATLRNLANLSLLDREDIPALKRDTLSRRAFDAVAALPGKR